MNRAQKRAEMRAGFNLSEFEKGRKAGFEQAGMTITKGCYAGVILMLKDVFNFTDDQCYDAVCALDQRMYTTIENSELADEVLEKTGITLRLNEPFDRVTKERKNADI